MTRVQDASAVEDVARCFSESYEEARAKFLNAARAAKAEQHELEICSDDARSYVTDIAIIRGKGAGLICVSSGTHGVEGYAGSAIQILLLDQLRATPVGPTVVFVHAVNPYGMAHFRRWNENNVDLNRNALEDHYFQQLMNHDRFRATYLGFDHFFNPTRVPSCFYVRVGVWFHAVFNIARYGLRKLKTALVAATYSSPKGIFFGGTELQPSHKLLKAFMLKHFGHVAASSVAWVDVHTGLGPCGVDVLLGDGAHTEEMAKLFPAVPREFDGFQGSFGKGTEEIIKFRCEPNSSGYETKGKGKVDQSAGYEYTVGVLGRNEWVSKFFKPDSGRVLAVTQEFGTCSNVLVARALILENMGYHYDRANHETWRTYTRDAFYVRTAAWKRSVLRRGEDVFRKLVGHLEVVAR